MCLELKTSALS